MQTTSTNPLYSATQADLAKHAMFSSDQFDLPHPGAYRDPLIWTIEETFDLTRLQDASQRRWKTWYRDERKMLIEDGYEESVISLETSWLATPTDDPVIIAEGIDKKFHVWDGNHRVGISCTHGVTHVPAIVGYRRLDLSALKQNRKPRKR